MKVQVRFKRFPSSDSLAEHVTRKVHQHLSRFGRRLSMVEARLGDVNGPRGGRDKRCLLTAHVEGAGPVHVEELHEDCYAAVDRAIGRLAEAVGRSVERTRRRHASPTWPRARVTGIW